MAEEYEKVYTVTCYWDGPREGVADYHGAPHSYTSLFDDKEDDWHGTYLLRPVDSKTIILVLEDWEIWRRWRKAFDEGRTTTETHPALPEDRARHEQLKPVLEERLAPDPVTAKRANGRFKRGDGEWRVRWTAVAGDT